METLTGMLWSFRPLCEEATWARYWMTFLVFSVLPAPDSPLCEEETDRTNTHQIKQRRKRGGGRERRGEWRDEGEQRNWSNLLPSRPHKINNISALLNTSSKYLHNPLSTVINVPLVARQSQASWKASTYNLNQIQSKHITLILSDGMALLSPGTYYRLESLILFVLPALLCLILTPGCCGWLGRSSGFLVSAFGTALMTGTSTAPPGPNSHSPPDPAHSHIPVALL